MSYFYYVFGKVEYKFDSEKNEKLKRERGISFEEIIALLDENHILDVVEHKTQDRYPGQKIYIVRVDHYTYLVPFVREKNNIFLKTIIPSRKATAEYLGRKQEKK